MLLSSNKGGREKREKAAEPEGQEKEETVRRKLEGGKKNLNKTEW